MTADDELLTTREVAAVLKVSPQTVARMAKTERLPGFRLPGGREWRFRRSEITRGGTDGPQG